MRVYLNKDYLNINGGWITPEPIYIYDIERIISSKLEGEYVANKNIIVSDSVVEFDTPAVFVSATSFIGNKNEGLYETTVLAYCIEESEYLALRLANTVRNILDGFGNEVVIDTEHISTIPQRNTETAPNTHTFAVSFRVLHMEL